MSFGGSQASTPARSSTPWLAVAGFLIGMAGIAAAISIGFLAMRGVLDVGGSCASGGPYVIATPCPDGTWLLPLAIFAGLGFAFLAAAGGTKIGGIYAVAPGLAWVGLFCSFGFNFLQWGIAPPADPSSGGGGPGLVFILIGLMFEVMGIVPVFTTLWAMRPGAPKPIVMFGGRSFDAAGGSQQVDLKELMSEIATTVAEARAKGIVGPLALTSSGLTSLGGAVAGAPAGAPAGDTGSGLVAELERLTTLHQSGNLTDEEFAAAKRNLIEKGS